MAAVGESGRDSGSDDPYVRLGLSQDATFEQVQAAKARCIAEVDGDDQARARVEAAYDSVLMARLRDRQQGQVSPAAATASRDLCFRMVLRESTFSICPDFLQGFLTYLRRCG